MKISDRDKMVLLVVVGIIVLVLSIFVFYPNITGDNETLEQEVEALKYERDQLNQLMGEKDSYENDALTMQAELEKMKAQFPVKIYPENSIMDMVNMEDELDIKVKSVESTEAEQVILEGTEAGTEEGTDIASTNTDDGTDTSEQDAQNLSENGMQRSTAELAIPELQQTYQSNYSLFKVGTNATFNTDYTGLKNVISYLKDLDKKNRGVISSLTATYNKDSGILNCAVAVNNYYMEGTDKAYEEPVVPNVDTGVSNLFGTLNQSSERKSNSQDENSDNASAEGTESTENPGTEGEMTQQ